MTPEIALERLRVLLQADFQVDPAAITPEAHLRADLGFDSLSLTDLAFLVRTDFGFTATPEDFRGVSTVGDLAAMITRHVP